MAAKETQAQKVQREFRERMQREVAIRKPAYLELVRILVEEEIPFSFSECQDDIEITDTQITSQQLSEALHARQDLMPADWPPGAFALKNVEDFYIEVLEGSAADPRCSISVRSIEETEERPR